MGKQPLKPALTARRDRTSGSKVVERAREPRHEEEAGPTWKKSVAREYFESIVIAVVLALFVRTFVVQTFKIPSGSMIDTLLIGDHILVNKFALARHPQGLQPLLPYAAISHADIVVFKYPVEPDKDYIKRVIGLPGDRIALRDGTLYRNGEPVEEPYVYFESEEAERAYKRERFAEYAVSEGNYFMMGDNRTNSSDSRRWGAVPRDHIKGRALIVYWSFDGPPGEPQGLGQQLKVLGEVVIHFFSRTRWIRTFMLVE